MSGDHLTAADLVYLGRDSGGSVTVADLTLDEARRLCAWQISRAEAAPNPVSDPREHLLPPAVWTFSSELSHIYRAAMCRQVSPDLVLQALLTRMASALHHESRVVTGGGESVLSYYVAAIAESGGGKTRGTTCAADLLDAWITDRAEFLPGEGWQERPLGSGEGLVEAFYGEKSVPKLDAAGEKMVDKQGNPVMVKVRAQVSHNRLFNTDEGRMLLAIAGRQGSTLMAVLCEMWSGSVAGQTNAEATRSRVIEARSYVVGVLLGFQPDTIDDLFADTAGGTPQRIIFAPAQHPDIVEDDVPWPGGLDPKVPTTPVSVQLPDHVRQEVRRHHVARARGQLKLGPLDGHRMLLRCRIAALLFLLHSTRERPVYKVTDEYWELAGTLVDTSCRLRDHLAGRTERKAAEQSRRREESAIRTQVTAATLVAGDSRVSQAADLIVRAVDRAGGELSRGKARNKLSRDRRDVAEAAISRAVADGRLVAEERDGATSGGPRRLEVLRLPDDGEDAS